MKGRKKALAYVLVDLRLHSAMLFPTPGVGVGVGGVLLKAKAVIQIPSGLKMWESQTWAGKPGGGLAVPFKEAGPIT